jgi:hypothetical protein
VSQAFNQVSYAQDYLNWSQYCGRSGLHLLVVYSMKGVYFEGFTAVKLAD